MDMNGFLIAAPQSGSGKTTVSLAVMAAFRRRGMIVAPFKCGPDFIDPGYHSLVTGRPAINLDGWMCPESFVSETFHLHAADVDVAVIEGVMGLFDGVGESSNEGSSAQVAAIVGAPVVLVVNARGMAASAAALVKGFAQYDPRVRLAGVIFNNVGGDSHGKLLRRVMAQALPEIPVFGCIPRDESLTISSRHLGLVTVDDTPLPPGFLKKLTALAERHLDLDGLAKLTIIPPRPPSVTAGDVSPRRRTEGGLPVRIAVARDEAFCFVYEDNLRLLREAGAEIVPFSPLHDALLPSDLCGIYLPGGYPELYAECLSANAGMIEAIRAAVEMEMPVYAECGGFVYLTRGMGSTAMEPLADFVGIFPVRSRMLPRRKALGYRQVEFLSNSVSGAAGEIVRGHEFHYSEVGVLSIDIKRCYRVTRQGVKLGLEGYRLHRCLASYIHLHFGSNPAIAPTFVASCRNFMNDQKGAYRASP